MTATSFHPNSALFADMPLDKTPWLANFGDEVPHLGRAAGIMPYQMQSLNQQEQLDLLASLERSRFPDAPPGLGGDTTVFYTAGLP